MSIGQNIPHDSSRGHVSGGSVFIDDRPLTQKEVFVLPIGVPAAAGILKSVDTSVALKAPGILGSYTAKDFHHNNWGTIIPEQPILVFDKIGYYDEPAVILVGTSMDDLLRAKPLVKFEIEKAPAILSLSLIHI